MRPAESFINLSDDQLAKISDGYCPDCNCRGWLIGPMAGHQINITCTSHLETHRFNVAFYSGKAIMGHRL